MAAEPSSTAAPLTSRCPVRRWRLGKVTSDDMHYKWWLNIFALGIQSHCGVMIGGSNHTLIMGLWLSSEGDWILRVGNGWCFPEMQNFAESQSFDRVFDRVPTVRHAQCCPFLLVVVTWTCTALTIQPTLIQLNVFLTGIANHAAKASSDGSERLAFGAFLAARACLEGSLWLGHNGGFLECGHPQIINLYDINDIYIYMYINSYIYI